MKKIKLSLISLLLILSLIVPALVACDGNEVVTTEPKETEETTETISSEIATTDESEVSSTVETDSEETTDKAEESDTEVTVMAPPLEDEDADLIVLANKLTNGVNALYGSGERNNLLITNQNMTLDYTMGIFDDKMVASIKNKNGKSYIENTMDVYVKMKGNDTPYFASGCDSPALMNTYRYGLYYYEILVDSQHFVDKINVEKELDLGLTLPDVKTGISQPVYEDGVLKTSVISRHDPYMYFKASLTPFAAADYNYIAITMKVDSKDTSTFIGSTLWVIAGDSTSFNESQNTGFRIQTDGEWHTYYIRIDGVKNYTGNVSGIRIEMDGLVGDTYEIKDIKALKGNTDGAPELGLNRIFNTFSDKLIQTIQITAKKDTSDIEEIGMITKIDADTVAKLIVKDANGHHDTLDGVDWNTAEYVGFDVKNVGIFGYILVADETSGKLAVTLEDGSYIITQSRAPKGNTLLKPTDETLNTGDFYMGQRIYTDATHDFDAFLKEAHIERNPLPAESFIIDYENSTKGAYVGYNALRGTYEFTLLSGGFGSSYYEKQNMHYGVRFTVKGDEYDRNIYMQSTLEDGQLECAAVLDKDNDLLPVPVEVCKNFADGDHTIHWHIDNTYSETYMPIPVSANSERTLNFLHLYQNWGRFPLKQISSIQFHCPYYHLSTGVTETNCIVNWYTTKSARSIYSVLPDHRAMSAPLWSREPQHTSGGSHGFLEYTDAEGNYVATENTSQTITSYGPTYAEIVFDYISDDGKIKATYTHMEMPQTDENRTYYTMTYEVLEDVSFNNFAEDFTFYSMRSNSASTKYQRIGYLTEANKPAERPVNTRDEARKYILGDECPYFTLFRDDDNNDYVNISFLVYNSEFVIGGEKLDPAFVIFDQNGAVRLSLDLKSVTLKKGDKFSINAIIMPWGSQETKYIADDEFEAEDFHPDQNVIDVRDNSLLNPLRATADNDCTVVESVFLPTVRSANGRSAEFTIAGGANNCTVKIEGFTSLTTPVVYEKNDDGEWVRYNLSSSYYPDSSDMTHDYDGYMVHYEKDGFLSYSFVVKMNKLGQPRSFKIVVDEAAWDPEVKPEKTEDEGVVKAELVEGYNRFIDADSLIVSAESGRLGKYELKKEGDKSFVRFYASKTNGDTQFYPYSAVNETDPLPTGQFFVFKYRLDADDTYNNWITIFSNTKKMQASTSTTVSGDGLIADGNWHVIVINYAATLPSGFTPDKDGGYYAKHVRFDVFGTTFENTKYIDIEYMAWDDSFEEILTANSDMESIIYFDDVYYNIPTDGGEMPIKIIIDDDTNTYDTPFKLYYSPRMLAHRMLNGGAGIDDRLIELVETPTEAYASLYGNTLDENVIESYLRFYVDKDATQETGQYFVIKYKTTLDSYFEFYASTETENPNGNELVIMDAKKELCVSDGEWHIAIIDLSKTTNKNGIEGRGFNVAEDGKYYAKVLRFDFFNSRGAQATGEAVTLGFMAITNDLASAITFDNSVPYVSFYDGTSTTQYDTTTGEVYAKLSE